MSSKVEKMLVCGSVEGNFAALYKRIAVVNKKNGPFTKLLCVGDFFGDDEAQWLPYKNGNVKVPILTYVLGPDNSTRRNYYPDLRGCQLCDDVVYLGPHGIYPCSDGLRIVYLSGSEAGKETCPPANSGTSFNAASIKPLELEAGHNPVIDILLTSRWPHAVSNYAASNEIFDQFDPMEEGSALVSRVAWKLKPRYHFVSQSNVHFERLPYRNHKILRETARHVTRFISLASVGNSEKRKWLYAFSMTPAVHLPVAELVKQPDDVTENPYSEENIPSLEEKTGGRGDGGAQFFYDMDSNYDDDRRGKKRRQDGGFQKNKQPHKPAGPCWFCLASPEVEKHLVVSVGESVYLALAKGSLTPDHLLILPVTHFQSSVDLSEDCISEIKKFKSALKKMCKKRGKAVVFFERNYKSQHLQIQVVPVPLNVVPELFNTFTEMAESEGLELNELPKHSDLGQVAPPGSPFFYVELPTGEKLYHRVKKNFPLQFGREVLASPPILNIPERVDWRTCEMSVEDATKLRDAVRSTFKPYDFTLEDDSDSD